MITNILITVLIILSIVIIFLLIFSKSEKDNCDGLDKNIIREIRSLNNHMSERMGDLNNNISDKMNYFNSNINDKQEMLRKSVISNILQQEERIKTLTIENTQHLENIRNTVKDSLSSIQMDNNKKLDEMRSLVDQKLQSSIENKMNESFRLVSERLEQVYKGLGEMNTLAKDVGDLKKVLSNVKTRGILGEVQLEAILNEILAPEQFEANVVVKPNSREVVEFAIKLPGDGDTVFLPIDSKFPGDRYQTLLDAYDSGDKNKVEECKKALERIILLEAKDISEKYICPPYTTNFAIMFLPIEGLYAEVIKMGMVEKLQNKFRVNIAGPSTMAALLNSLQMGFNTLAIRKRSDEIELVLKSVKTEFDKFEDVLVATQRKLENANNDLDKLIGVRTRQIKNKLKNVSTFDDK